MYRYLDVFLNTSEIETSCFPYQQTEHQPPIGVSVHELFSLAKKLPPNPVNDLYSNLTLTIESKQAANNRQNTFYSDAARKWI